MRIKKNKKTKEKMISVRVSEDEYNSMKIKAHLYTEGNLSEWIVFSSSKYKPQKEEIE